MYKSVVIQSNLYKAARQGSDQNGCLAGDCLGQVKFQKPC